MNHKDAVHEDLLRFNRLWLANCAPDSLLVFSTGRSPELFRELAVSALGSAQTYLLAGGERSGSATAHWMCIDQRAVPLLLLAFESVGLSWGRMLRLLLSPLRCAARLQDEVPLLTPNILVCSVGTEILIDGEARFAGDCMRLTTAWA